MKRTLCALALLFATSLTTNANSASCLPGNEIWANDSDDGVRTVVYLISARSSSSPKLIFEGWRGREILWRISGSQPCSNGVVICTAMVPLTKGDDLEAPVDVIYEGGEPRYIVFAQLRQVSFRVQVYSVAEPELDAEWFHPKPSSSTEDGPTIVLPSYYRFIGCQKGDELEAGSQ